MATLDLETTLWLRDTFRALNQAEHSRTREREEVIPLQQLATRLPVSRYFHKFTSKKWSFSLVATDTKGGIGMENFMMEVAQTMKETQGFRAARSLLLYSLRSFFSLYPDADFKVAAFYLTRQGNNVDIVTTGIVWAGLYRDGKLVRATSKSLLGGLPYYNPEILFKQLTGEAPFVGDEKRLAWQVCKDDILVLTRGDLPENFDEIVDIAVEVADLTLSPASQISNNLRNYFSIGRDAEDVFAAMRIT